MNTPDISPKALREFAVVMSAAVTLIFCLLLPWLFEHSRPMWPLVVAGILLLQAAIHPPSLVPVQKAWFRLGGILGWINTRIVLALVFFVLITPIGWLQRKRGKLQYKTGYENASDTYKIARKPFLSADDLENPF